MTNQEEWGEPVAGQSFGRTWNFDTDATLEGYYLGDRETEIADTSEPTGSRLQIVHDFQLEPAEGGEEVSAWGAHDLDAKLREIEPGQYVRVVYQGKEAIIVKGQPRSVKRYEVRGHGSKRIDVSNRQRPTTTPQPQAAGAGGGAAGGDDDIPF